MAYEVKYSDLKGDIEKFPIEVVQRMVDLSNYQGRWSDERGMETFQTNVCSAGYNGLLWRETPEGHTFWDKVISDRKWDGFYKVYPELFGDKIRYAIVKNGYGGIPECIWRYVGEDHGFAEKSKDGDIYFVENVGGKVKVKFAIKDSPRYKRVIANGTEIKY